MVQQVNGNTYITPAILKENQSLQPTKLPDTDSFGDILQTALNHVSRAEHASDKKTELLAKGQIDNLHDVMITAQKAKITVETAVEVQQKAIDIYNEVMRMQI